jgi:L-fucose isomerase
MGIGGSIIDPDFIESYLGMRVESVDEVEIIRRMDKGIYDKAEFEKAYAWAKEKCIIGFDKNSDKELVKKTVTVDDICCEYCVMGNVYDLLLMKGIEKVSTDYDFEKCENINFFIEYDKDLISEEDVNKWKFV